ncbi:hypothetical protein CIB84_008135 [Bambusicola thoracicus]|uniref:Uncharacterized protein n=1 Tax=Bambusicola thoracicus TaxID=9083 RepID=A0A2P4SVG8_BAMTH|nr:hypothetical protein CIB84_008135 [Bambusicola thoracicus]
MFMGCDYMLSSQESCDNFLSDIPVTREQINHYRAAAETAQSELAALSVKYDCAHSELLELRSRMISKETSFKELKSEAENYKENNARQASLLLSLQTRVWETEEELSVLVASKKQAELTAQAALKENWELKEKLREQNSRLQYLSECEESKTECYKMSRKYEELLTQLSEFLDTDIKGKEKPEEHLMSKACEISKENLALKAQVAALQEDINGHEMESKASRETIMRLVSEVTKEQKKAAGYYEEMEKLSKAKYLKDETELKACFEKKGFVVGRINVKYHEGHKFYFLLKMFLNNLCKTSEDSNCSESEPGLKA